MKREVKTDLAPEPIGPYSQAVETTHFPPGSGSVTIYCSGQVGLDKATGKLEEGVAAQTWRALNNLEQVLRSVGMNLNDVVKSTVFMVNLAEFAQMNEEYAKHFSGPFPARSTVQVAALPRGALVEIEVIAARG